MLFKNFFLIVLLFIAFSRNCAANIATDSEAILFNIDDLKTAPYHDFFSQIKQSELTGNIIGMYENVFSDIQKDTLSYDSAIVMCHVSLKETPFFRKIVASAPQAHSLSLEHVYDEAELSKFAEASNSELHQG
jgi:hypothetical protein